MTDTNPGFDVAAAERPCLAETKGLAVVDACLSIGTWAWLQTKLRGISVTEIGALALRLARTEAGMPNGFRTVGEVKGAVAQFNQHRAAIPDATRFQALRQALQDAAAEAQSQVDFLSFAPTHEETRTMQRSLIVAVSQRGTGYVVSWGDDEVVEHEVRGTSEIVEDIGLPGVPEEPGLYRWTGTITYDGSEDGEAEWNGSFEKIEVAEWLHPTPAAVPGLR